MAAKKTGFIVGAVAGAGVAAAALAGAGLRLPPAVGQTAQHQPLAVTKTSMSPIFAPPPGAPLSFADIFDRVSPAVVSINVKSKVDARAMTKRIPGFPFDILPQTPQGQDGPPAQREALSAGSGFFVSRDGYVVTNNHVVENAEDITVIMKDERELKAKVVGRDEGTDLAVLKVQTGGDFPFVDFENSGKPRVGDWVMTVGNPFGLGGTATAGIVSAYGRDIGEQFVDYIQIDAPINRGNSGGPTFDVYGRVIGVNTAIFSPSGGSVGIGFAIPSEIADRVVKQLISGGKVTRGYMGAVIQTLTPETADSIGLSGRKGALVAELTPGGPADKAGVHQGDVVVGITGKPVANNTDLTRQVAATKTGDVMRLDVVRDGKTKTIEVRAGVRPSEKTLAANDNSGDDDAPAAPDNAPAARPNVLGMTLAPLDEAARRRYTIGKDVRGVVIDAVQASSDAGQKGLRRGDVISGVKLADATVVAASPAQVAGAVDAARKAGRTSVLLQIVRDGRPLFLPVKIEK